MLPTSKSNSKQFFAFKAIFWHLTIIFVNKIFQICGRSDRYLYSSKLVVAHFKSLVSLIKSDRSTRRNQLYSPYFFKKMGQPRPLLFIFFLFKHKFYRKNCRRQRFRTRIVGVEVKHSDHLTTTTAPIGSLSLGGLFLSLVHTYGGDLLL